MSDRPDPVAGRMRSGARPAPVGSLPSLRQRNRSLVIRTVRDRHAASRAEIARFTGLSRTTVSSLVADLLADNVLVEVPAAGGAQGSGRPATPLTLHPERGCVVGIHFGHDGVRVALAQLDGTVLSQRYDQLDVDHRPADSIGYAAATALELIRCHHPERVFGTGVAISTPVTAGSRLLSAPSMLPSWAEVDVAGRLRDFLSIPVYVGNDANLGALAEFTHGAGRGVKDLIYVMLSDGVGAGLIVDGRLYEGSTGSAGELGHVAVTPDGYICRCGNRGCLETVAGARGVVEAMTHSRGQGTDLDDVLDLCEQGDPGARRVLNDAGRAVGGALAGVCTVLDPKLVVIGGKIAAVGDTLLDGIRDVLTRTLPPVTNQNLEVVAGELGQQAELVGAVVMAIHRSGPGR